MHWFDIKGWLKIAEGNALQQLALNKRVLEIGSLFGRSTVCMAITAQHIDAVDPHNALSIEPGHEWHGMDTYAEFMKNNEQFNVSQKISVYRSRIEDLELAHQYAFAFIDGDHTYDACKRDIAIVRSVLLPGSTFAVHDYYSGSKNHHGVIRAVNEVATEPGVKLRTVNSLAIISGAV